jgi:2-dehydropantoate 2-reductase
MVKENNYIYIIGTGAIGKALAVLLTLAERQVLLIRGTLDDGSIQRKSLQVEIADGTTYEADISITTLSNISRFNGIVVLANKSYGNEQLAITLKDKIGHSPLVLLQNGLGVEQPFIRNEFPEIYRCVLFVTSQQIDPVTVRFKPVAVCPVGIERGDTGTLNTIIEALDTQTFRFKDEAHIQQIIWKKAIVNCVFNSVCVLLEIDNGIFHRNKEALDIARRVILECTIIARAKGIVLYPEEIEQSLLDISRLSDGQLISTLQDIRNNRKTEIETLNPEIIRIAESLQKQDAVRETRLLGALVKLKSELTLHTSHTDER